MPRRVEPARAVHLPRLRELRVERLDAVGRIPEGLEGRLVHVGPAPTTIGSEGSSAQGLFMVHEVCIAAGRADYRSAWLAAADADAVYSGLVSHVGRLRVLGTGGGPVELDEGLAPVTDAIGAWGSGAHAHVDPVWDDLVVVEAATDVPRITVTTLDARGRVRESVEIATDTPVLIHDFAFTSQHVVVVASGAVEAGGEMLWDPTAPARIGLLPRDANGPTAQWFAVSPRVVWHFVNAFERDDEVVIDHVAHRQPVAGTPGPAPLPGATAPFLCRTVVVPTTGEVRDEILDDRAVEFPAIDPRRGGLRHRIAYAALAASRFADHCGEFDGLVRYDLRDETAIDHVFPSGTTVGAPVVAARRGGTGEDDAWVLALTTDASGPTSRLVVFDPRTFAQGPIAEVVLPQALPAGHHLLWDGV